MLNPQIMKKLFTLFCFLYAVSTNAQNPIPNPGFESWTGNDPEFWMATNNNTYVTVTPTDQSYSGDSAVKGTAIVVWPSYEVAPFLYAGSGTQGILVNQYYSELTFWYMIDMVFTDEMHVEVRFFDSNATLIASGSQVYSGSVATYTKGTVPVFPGSGTPASCIVSFAILNPVSVTNAGSWFIVDDVELNTTTGIGGDAKEQYISVYPNPAADVLHIKTGTVPDHSTLDIYDMQGQLVKSFAVVPGSTTVSVNDFPAGVYFCRVKNNMTTGELQKLVIIR